MNNTEEHTIKTQEQIMHSGGVVKKFGQWRVEFGEGFRVGPWQSDLIVVHRGQWLAENSSALEQLQEQPRRSLKAQQVFG